MKDYLQIRINKCTIQWLILIVLGLVVLFIIGMIIHSVYQDIYDLGYNHGYRDAINKSMQNDIFVTFELDGNSKTFYTAGNCPKSINFGSFNYSTVEQGIINPYGNLEIYSRGIT